MSDPRAPKSVPRCEACQEPLESVHESETDYQFNNALWIGLFGGYGMFVDDLEGGDERLPGSPHVAAVICHNCAHELCDNAPWLSNLVKPYTSHSHRAGKPWGSHSGWDLMSTAETSPPYTEFGPTEK